VDGGVAYEPKRCTVQGYGAACHIRALAKLGDLIKFTIEGDRVVGMDLTIDPDTLSRVSW
jgi:hypothetical protein